MCYYPLVGLNLTRRFILDSNTLISKRISTSVFNDYFGKLKKDYAGKKVLIYGAGWSFEKLNSKLSFDGFNIVAISDIKFIEPTDFLGFNAIPPSMIKETDFDVIFMTLYYPQKAISALERSELIDEKTNIEIIFDEIIPQENEFLFYLEKINFERHLKKFAKKLKNKKVVIYGAGVFFQVVNEYFDLSDLNIVAVADRKFIKHKKDEKFLGYYVCAPDEIEELKPDYLLVATRFFIDLIEDLEENMFKKSKIKIRPLIKKPLIELLREIWC